MQQKHSIVAALICGVLILTACQSEVDLDSPPEIVYGEDLCDHCNMIISEPRYAASYLTTSGTPRLFDDIGGMMLYHVEHNEEVHSFWVHDYVSAAWIRGENAFYVITSDLYTPMDYGIFAFESEGRAAEFADEESGSDILSLSDLLALAENGTFELDHHHDMQHTP